MENNSYFKNTNSFSPFGNLQGITGGTTCASRLSAPTHDAAFLTPPPQRGQLPQPRVAVGRGVSYGQIHAIDHNSRNTFKQVPFESRGCDNMPRSSFAPVAQFHPPHRIQQSSWNINVNVPPPPTGVAIHSPLPNVNMPPPAPVNRNIPPPGFNPRVPPPFFNPCAPPPVIATSSSANTIAANPMLMTSTARASSFTSRPFIGNATNEQIFGISPAPVPAFVNHQRMHPVNRNVGNQGESTIGYKAVRQSGRSTLSSDGGTSISLSDHSFVERVYKSPTTYGNKRAGIEQCCDGTCPSLSSADNSTHLPSGRVAAVAAAYESLESRSRRRRRISIKNDITFVKFRQLLKEAILLNDRLRKYKKCLCSNAESDVNESEELIVLEPTMTCRSDEAIDDSQNTASLLNETSQSYTNKSAEKRTVRIVPANTHHKDQSLSSSAASLSNDKSLAVIDNQESVNIQERLKELQVQITSFIDAIVARQKRTASKRLRLKRRRRLAYEANCELLMKRQRRHDEIDKYMNEVRQKQLAAKMELEMKAAADVTLAEVRRKISETNNSMKLIGRLRKLRQLRKDQAERKGVVVRRTVDEAFEQRVEALTTTLKGQMELYEAEQRTLQVMLETEHEQTKEKEREMQQVRVKERLASYEDQLHTWLFGSQSPVGPLDPVFPYAQYYDLANYSVDTFVKIRQEWDVYAVPAGSGSGSGIPPGWVIPSEPADEVWASALKH